MCEALLVTQVHLILEFSGQPVILLALDHKMSQDVTRCGPGPGVVTGDVSSPVSALCQDPAPAHCVISTAVSPFLILTILPERLGGKPGRVRRPGIRDSHNNNGEQRRGNNLNEQSDNRADNVTVSDSNISQRMWEMDVSQDKLKC